MNGYSQNSTPYGGGDPYGGDHGGHGYGRGRIRSKPVGLKTVAAISAAQWIGRRVASRLTPLWLVLLALVGVPLAFLTDPEVIGVLGLCGCILTYATQRHVSPDDRVARQWALRMLALPVTGTAWCMTWWAMHARGMDVINKRMFLGFLLYGCTLWSWLYVSRFVGGKVAWERAQRDFAPVARRVGIAGAAIVKTTKTAVGTRRLLDVRGTGSTPAQLAKSPVLADQLAGHDGLPPGKVRVTPSAEHAGYVEVSTWITNPWKDPIKHPGAACGFALPVASPIGPFVIGRDPETEKDLTIEIVNDEGGVHWVFIAGTRGGKTNLINNVVEHLTRCCDAKGRRIVKIIMIDILKGMKDAANWGPAVHEVHGGPKTVHAANASLQRGVELIAERAELNGRRGRSKHVPTHEEPIVVYIIDEASFLLSKRSPEGRRAVELVNGILKAGASELVLLMIASQRAVLEHLGGGDVKANAFGVAVLPVRRAIEQTNIISDWRDQGMPDMSKYGDGAKGTVLLSLNGEWTAGRTFELHEMQTVRKIALDRALPQNAAKAAEWRAQMGLPAASASAVDPLLRELPEDGRDGPDVVDAAAELDFDAGPDEVLPSGEAASRPGDRPAALPAGTVARPDVRPGDPLTADDVRAPGTVRASGAGADDDDAVEAAYLGARPDAWTDEDAPPWVVVDAADAAEQDAMIEDMLADAEASGELDEAPDQRAPEAGRDTSDMDPMDQMSVAVDRMLDITKWARAVEEARTDEERRELSELWRRRTYILDQSVELPGAVNAALAALAGARGPAGFTAAEARECLIFAEALSGRETVSGHLRVLVNQGHLERRRGAAQDGSDLFVLGERHRKAG